MLTYNKTFTDLASDPNRLWCRFVDNMLSELVLFLKASCDTGLLHTNCGKSIPNSLKQEGIQFVCIIN